VPTILKLSELGSYHPSDSWLENGVLPVGGSGWTAFGLNSISRVSLSDSGAGTDQPLLNPFP
jgi:hypothetical protein